MTTHWITFIIYIIGIHGSQGIRGSNLSSWTQTHSLVIHFTKNCPKHQVLGQSSSSSHSEIATMIKHNIRMLMKGDN